MLPFYMVSALSEVPSTSQLSVASEDTGLDEESESFDIKSQSGVSTASSSAYSSEINQSEQGSQNNLDTIKDSERELGVLMNCDSEYSNIEIGDIQDDKSEQSNLSNVNAGSQETLLSIKSLSPTHQPESRLEIIGQDMNGNPEIVEAEPTYPSPDVDEEICLDGLGDETQGLPLLYFVRVMCRRFLLTTKNQELLADRRVRVSMKCLALGSVACAVKIAPAIFLERLLVGNQQGRLLPSGLNIS